jgi:hypothetical protein
MYDWQSRTRGWRNLRITAGDLPGSSTERIAPDIAASIVCTANSSGEVLVSGADSSIRTMAFLHPLRHAFDQG